MKGRKQFVLMAGLILALLLQWYVPLSMIVSAENVLRRGSTYRFRTAPVDPVDFFRGRYLVLNFDEPVAFPGDNYPWTTSEERAFVTLSTDEEGFARFGNVFKERPDSDEDYIEVTARKHWNSEKEGLILVELPVDRFYMDEFKAPEAEEFYNSALRGDRSERNEMEAWVEAKVKDGTMIVEELMVGNKPLREWLELENTPAK